MLKSRPYLVIYNIEFIINISGRMGPSAIGLINNCLGSLYIVIQPVLLQIAT